MSEKVRQIHPYSRPHTLAKLDGRTKESHVVRATRADLLAHVGNNPSVVQLALIEQLVQLKLRIAVMDRKFIKVGTMTDHDTRTYLAWCNTYGRMLHRLGLQPSRQPTIHEVLASRAIAR
jgi:hypothetical protein